MRLIDADELLDEICREQCERKFADCDGMCEMAAAVVNAPTVGVDAGAKLIPWNDLEISCGAGWVEIWYEPEDGEPESFEILRCVWLFGNLMVDDGCHSTTDTENLKRMYNRKFGQRIWTNCPTEEQRKAVKWG